MMAWERLVSFARVTEICGLGNFSVNGLHACEKTPNRELRKQVAQQLTRQRRNVRGFAPIALRAKPTHLPANNAAASFCPEIEEAIKPSPY